MSNVEPAIAGIDHVELTWHGIRLSALSASLERTTDAG